MTNLVKHIDATLPVNQPDPMVSMIERMAFDPNSDLDKLERMLAMKERLDTKNARVAYTHALAATRANIPPIVKDATVDFKNLKGGRTHYQHETLAGIAKAIDPILSADGLSYRFRTDQSGGQVKVTCIISHRDGHSEETTLCASPDQSGNKNNFQAVGSAVTYLQRYTLKAALGLSAEVDDDAQGASPRRDTPPVKESAPAFDYIAAAESIRERISAASSKDDLAEIWKVEIDMINAIKSASAGTFDTVRECFTDRAESLANPTDDEIPYEGAV